MNGSDSVGAPKIVCENLWKVYGAARQNEIEQVVLANMQRDAARKQYGLTVGVAGVSFEIRKGEIFCIMGLSGSGKSTLLRHVNRLIEPSAGRVSIDGVDLSTLSKRELDEMRSKHIGMVFQHMALWPHRNIIENVAFGLEVRGVDRARREQAASEALKLVQLPEWGNHYPDELSGGMQQRVGLARALAADPDVLLMDEPFSALDPLIRRDMQNDFLALVKAMGKTVLFITHDLEEAIKLGDRVAVMRDGYFVQIGTPLEILTKPKNDYVGEFVRGVSQLHHLSAKDATIPCKDVEVISGLGVVNFDARLDEMIEIVGKAESSVAVRENGSLIGVVTKDSLLSSIAKRLPRS